jgi:hypothetical protein
MPSDVTCELYKLEITCLSQKGLTRPHYATSRKNAGSHPDEVDFFSNLPNPSGRTIALG